MASVPLRLSHPRLMAMVHGRAGVATLRQWRAQANASRPHPDGMTARQRFFANAGEHDAARLVSGAFCPPLTHSGKAGRRGEQGKYPVYQGSSALGKNAAVEMLSEDASRYRMANALNMTGVLPIIVQ